MTALRGGAAVSVIAAALAVGATPAAASFDACSYDGATRTVSASLTTSHDAALRVGALGEILNGSIPCGAATTANTDEVVVNGTSDSDRVTVDNSGAGGAFRKPGGSDEIHFDVDLGEQCEGEVLEWCLDDPQVLKVVGTTGDDDIRVGAGDAGIEINLDASSDVDADVVWGRHSSPRRLARRGPVTRPLRRPHYFDPPPAVELDGGEGDDTLTGGYRINAILRGGADDDLLVGGGERDVLYPGAGDDVVHGSLSGTDLLSYADAPHGVTANLSSGHVANDGFGGRDTIDTRYIKTIRGSSHADRLAADYFGTTILGGAGDDLVSGGSDHDTLYGEDGNDRIEASWDRSRRYAGDTMYGGRGDDVLHGGTGPDVLYGGPGQDVLKAGHGKGPELRGALTFTGGDRLIGGAGDDLLEGGPNADIYVFGAPVIREKDTIVERPDEGRDTVEFDYFELRNFTADTEIDLGSRARRFATSGSRTLRTLERGGARDIENILIGGYGHNRIAGNAQDNLIQSGGDEDTIDCRGGHDTVVASEHDRLRGCEVVKAYR